MKIMFWSLLLLAAPACSSSGDSNGDVSSSAGASSSSTAASSGGSSPGGYDAVDLPGGSVGIGLDDLRFSTKLDRIVSPAGRTGAIDLVDPDTLEVTSIPGFSAFDTWNGSDLQGVESADEGGGLVFGNDRTAQKLGIVDPSVEKLVASVQLDATEPDYVRYVASTSEVWITQPGKGRIDVLSVPASGDPTPLQAAYIPVPAGPEGLAIDNTRKRAYTHASGGIAVIDLVGRTVLGTWPTGCSSEHGIPQIDEARGLLFAGCSAAEVVVLDLDNGGAELDRYPLGSGGATILAYSPSLRHFYLRGDGGVKVATLGVGPSGKLSLLGTVDAMPAGHCMTADDRGRFWVCDWKSGRLLRFVDPYPATAP